MLSISLLVFLTLSSRMCVKKCIIGTAAIHKETYSRCQRGNAVGMAAGYPLATVRYHLCIENCGLGNAVILQTSSSILKYMAFNCLYVDAG
jgi:sulfopyruvate decarboxylase TPP-binding subunit